MWKTEKTLWYTFSKTLNADTISQPVATSTSYADEVGNKNKKDA